MRQTSAQSSTETKENDTKNVRIFLIGDLSSAARAFHYVFSHAGAGICCIPFDGSDPNATVDAISKHFPEPVPALLVSASNTAWQALRVLNVWQLDAGVFTPTTTHPSVRIPKVIPLPHILYDTLLDLFATNSISNGGWVAQTLNILASAKGRFLAPNDVKRAILHYIAAVERHSLKMSRAAGTHGRNDAIAALRVAQGAIMDQGLDLDAGKAACEKVCSIGAYFESKPDWNESPFFNLVSQLGPVSKSIAVPFASIVVADDEGFWSEPMEPIWNRLGFALVSQPTPGQVTENIRRFHSGGAPVRAVLLDMELHGDRLGGARLLQMLHQGFPHLPVIALSVDDQFSETVLLKRMGAFAYLNKHALAEPHPGRDALSAFRQLKDAVLAAGFASLTMEFSYLSETLSEANARMVEQEKHLDKALRKKEVDNANKAENLLSPLAKQVRESLFVYVEECRRMFHGYWQDSAYPCGTACRQIIRALGLVNDKWSSLWKTWHFDPDGYEGDNGKPYADRRHFDAWLNGVDIRFPFWPYQEITTAIRNAASHAVITDLDFTWIDVWIVFLALFLKMEGICRAYCEARSPSYGAVLSRQCDQILHRLVCTLKGLLISSGCNAPTTLPDDLRNPSEPQLRASFTDTAKQIQQQLSVLPGDEKPLTEGDPAWLSLKPYHLAFRTKDELMCGFLQKWETGFNLSPQQSSASLLLLHLISHRLSDNLARIPRV
jgi:CheY-like chemotaxis protein